MKTFPKDYSQLLSQLTEEIKTAPRDRAKTIIHQVGYWFILAGYGQAAYESLSSLLNGTLRLSPSSALMHSLKDNALPYLCYTLNIPCPAIADRAEMSGEELAEFVRELERQSLSMMLIDPFSLAGIYGAPTLFNLRVIQAVRYHFRWVIALFHPLLKIFPPKAPPWTDKTLQKMLGLSDEKPRDREIYAFLQEVHRVIQAYCRNDRLHEAIELAEQYDAIRQTWNLATEDWISKAVQIIAIAACFQVGKEAKAKARLVKWWHQNQERFNLNLFLPNHRAIFQALLEGLLEDEIGISQEQVATFLDAIRNYSYIPQTPKIPSVSDWKELMEAWNRNIFSKTSEEERESFADWFPDATTQKDCSQPPATEEEIQELEQRLGQTLPPSYRNFLLYSNGWTVANMYQKLFGTQEVDWFNTLNQEWVEAWTGIEEDEISDEKYFQYGEHQDCVYMRSRYLETALQISTDEDGYVYLLNPMVVDERGEWEAWDFGNKHPGAYRYRSFWEMMQATYNSAFGE
ncbi:SMI1/KNR4 family protein [Lusitaniella coriacea LEGE 07157]|uniref:SMI1/KNR4 family protein n=1 Tax=Lusitaniella coriacea LEGE 07157 TaxID=945747 RepID=A0A8J7ARK6_9CYAN|nr:SMI1/KNR4 family protein [Lusitaniella coriacea]MBE9114806.1 SMI1/KNR4 family protein [Lusitaniella coriacea LEGE 07157]